MGARELDLRVQPVEVEAFVRDLFFGERALWNAIELSLVTHREVASAICDRVFTRFKNLATSAPSEQSCWPAFPVQLEKVLCGTVGN